MAGGRHPLPGYPYRYERTASIVDLQDRFGALEPGAETKANVSVAGRIRTVRAHGKVAFADLEDATGKLQLFAQIAVVGDEGIADFGRIGVGDIVGATGEVIKTRRGELSVRVAGTTILAPCLRSMPEKWHGMSDIERRYRQRYLDLIVNPVAARALEARAATNGVIRSFLDGRGFVEVETPLLQPLAGGTIARPFVTHHNALDIDLYLRIAPELYLKRLLIGGVEKLYELNRCFRNEGVSSQHNPEFTMLECYEAYVDYEDSMALVEDLVREVARAIQPSLEFEIAGRRIDLSRPFARVTMIEAIAAACGRDLGSAWRSQDQAALRSVAADLDVRIDDAWPPGKVLAEIFEAIAEATLIEPTFVVGYPKEVSPLAKDHRSIPGFTEQADLIIGGVEMAPIYSELNDPQEQQRRFEQQAAARAAGDEEAMVKDEDFLEALAYGMPPAGGFGLGVDRLLTPLLGLSSLREVILFPTLRPEA